VPQASHGEPPQRLLCMSLHPCQTQCFSVRSGDRYLRYVLPAGRHLQATRWRWAEACPSLLAQVVEGHALHLADHFELPGFVRYLHCHELCPWMDLIVKVMQVPRKCLRKGGLLRLYAMGSWLCSIGSMHNRGHEGIAIMLCLLCIHLSRLCKLRNQHVEHSSKDCSTHRLCAHHVIG
jgi:hypothetical protein